MLPHTVRAVSRHGFHSSAVPAASAQRKATARAAGRGKAGAPARPRPRPQPHSGSANFFRRDAPPHRMRSETHRARQPQHARQEPRLTLREAERAVRADLASLSRRLSDTSQRQAAEAAAADLPPLDEETLETVYEALQMPEPPDAETQRLAQREAQRIRIAAATMKARRMLPRPAGSDAGLAQLSPSQSHALRLHSRLEALVTRLGEMDRGVGTSGSAAALEGLAAERLALAHRVGDLLEARRAAGSQGLLADEPEEEAPSASSLEQHVSFDAVDLVAAPRQGSAAVQAVPEAKALFTSSEARTALLDKVEQMVQQLPQVATEALPAGLVGGGEWRALAVASAVDMDDEALSRCIDLMRRSGAPRDTAFFNALLDVYAERGQTERCQAVLSVIRANQLEPDSHTDHCMVKAYIKSERLNVALAMLNELEETRPASMATYTMVLTALLSAPRAAQPTFWSLFHRMRLSAHPVPDAPLYAVAIHACAEGIPNPGEPAAAEADAERALDLFREMTTHHGIRPTAQTYNALMLACAKRRDMLPEAFRLLREMVELERTRLRALSHEAEASEALTCFAPDRQTYNALLLGCARAGDLPQARWILAEMLRSASALWEENMHRQGARLLPEEALEVEGRRPDAASLTHLFHAYASYKPPLKLASLRNAAQEPAPATAASAETTSHAQNQPDSLELASAEDETSAITTPSAAEAAQSFTPRVPQTSAEVLSEVRGLMGRILADLEAGAGLLANVRPSAHLIHAYLSALCEHLPGSPPLARLATVRNAVFGSSEGDKSLFARLGVEPNGHTYELVLAQCAAAPEGALPDRLAAQAWQAWRALEDAHPRAQLSPRMAKKLGLEERTVSRIWAAMIRCHAKASRLDEALALLRAFTARYPAPQRPGTPTARAPLSSLLGPVTGSELVSATAGAVAPSPRLSFAALELLHHRLVAAERAKDLAFVGWVVHSYSASAKPRVAVRRPPPPTDELFAPAPPSPAQRGEVRVW